MGNSVKKPRFIPPGKTHMLSLKKESEHPGSEVILKGRKKASVILLLNENCTWIIYVRNPWNLNSHWDNMFVSGLGYKGLTGSDASLTNSFHIEDKLSGSASITSTLIPNFLYAGIYLFFSGGVCNHVFCHLQPEAIQPRCMFTCNFAFCSVSPCAKGSWKQNYRQIVWKMTPKLNISGIGGNWFTQWQRLHVTIVDGLLSTYRSFPLHSSLLASRRKKHNP